MEIQEELPENILEPMVSELLDQGITPQMCPPYFKMRYTKEVELKILDEET